MQFSCGRRSGPFPFRKSNPYRRPGAPVTNARVGWWARASWGGTDSVNVACGPVGVRSPPSSGCQVRQAACVLRGMHIIYIVTTCLAAFVNGYAAFLNFTGAESVEVVADRLRVPRGWMVPLGTLLACGAVGLLSGFAVPVLGTAAAIGLVLYFICAVVAHLRVGDRQIGGPVSFLLLAAAALATSIAYDGHSVNL